MASPMQLRVAPPMSPVQPGVHLHCFGPLAVPEGSRALYRFQPEVNMDIVHH